MNRGENFVLSAKKKEQNIISNDFMKLLFAIYCLIMWFKTNVGYTSSQNKNISLVKKKETKLSLDIIFDMFTKLQILNYNLYKSVLTIHSSTNTSTK